MTDTTAPAPTWLVVIQGLMPSLNQCLVVAVTASVTFISTLGMQRLTTPHMSIPAADKPAPVSIQKQINDAVNRLDGRFGEVLSKVGDIHDRVIKIEGKRDTALDQIEQVRKDWRIPAAAVRAAPKPASK